MDIKPRTIITEPPADTLTAEELETARAFIRRTDDEWRRKYGDSWKAKLEEEKRAKDNGALTREEIDALLNATMDDEVIKANIDAGEREEAHHRARENGDWSNMPPGMPHSQEEFVQMLRENPEYNGENDRMLREANDAAVGKVCDDIAKGEIPEDKIPMPMGDALSDREIDALLHPEKYKDESKGFKILDSKTGKPLWEDKNDGKGLQMVEKNWENPEALAGKLKPNEKGGIKNDGEKPWMRLLQFDVLGEAEKVITEKGHNLSFMGSYLHFRENRCHDTAVELLAAVIYTMMMDGGRSIWQVYWDIAKILTLGAKKYAPDNWKKVEPDRYEDALLRHFAEYSWGETKDEESGLSHWPHIGCNAMFLASLYGN